MKQTITERVCETCGANMQPNTTTQEFEYGRGSSAVLLRAVVPFWSCERCGDSVADWRAEAARDEAVCRHLGVLTPQELKELRRSLGLSQAQLAQLTRIGVASIKRWESGGQPQSPSLDLFLRLLQYPEVVEHLRSLSLNSEPQAVSFDPNRFRTTLSEKTISQSTHFRLH